MWDYKMTAARLTWAFPTNPQRDIKYFQVFRRSSISQSFELIKMFDFDDSVIRTPWTETPDEVLIERLSSPKNFFLDTEFNKESKYIYAICCVDAHGISSNYSIQFEVSFDRFKNKMKKKLISVAGAPKAYPNMYLNQDTFVDTIKDSNHSQVEIFFNPEYLQITDEANNDLKLLKMDENNNYILSLLNIDLQSQKNVTIVLKDKRILPGTE